MINREIVYERNLIGSFMKIAAGIHPGLDEKLMLQRKLPGLLPVEKAYVDGNGQYWYNISGRQSLDMYCRVKEIGISFIEKLIISICSEMEILEWNLIQTNCLMLDPELIFVTNSNQEIIFTVYPTEHGTIETEFRQLMEYLLTKIDHKDPQAVRAAYGIYEKTLMDGYAIRDIQQEIVKAKQQECLEKPKPKPEPVAMPVSESRPQDQSPKERKQKKKPKHNHKEKRNKPWLEKLKNLLVEAGIAEPEETNAQDSKKARRREEPKKQKPTVVYPQEEIPAAPQPQYRPTVCLSSMEAAPKGLLVYQGSEDYADIRLTEPVTHVGFGMDVDVRIPADTVSQLHARIDREADAYYIEDLNSTNGTYINEEPLAYKERRKLNSNDRVRFADARYRFY